MRIMTDTTATLHLTGIDQGLGEALAHLALQAPGCRFAAADQPHPDIDRHVIKIKASPNWRDAWSWALQSMAAFVDSVPEAEKGELSFPEADAVLLNALRRAVIGAVPTHAFTHFTVIENTSSICDDILIRRISQLPLAAADDADAMQLTLCASLPTLAEQQSLHWRMHRAMCTWRRRRHPGDDRRRPKLKASRVVTHNEAAIRGGEVGGLSPMELVPLLVLCPGESVHVTASSSRGTGDDHPRFTSVTGVRFAVEDGVATFGFTGIGQLPCSRILAHAKAHLLSVIESIDSRCEEQQLAHTVDALE